MKLRAGGLDLLYYNGDLRQISYGDIEVLNRVYCAVRDHNWGTIPMQRSDENIVHDDSSFEISYTARHQQDDIDFQWYANITGKADGTVTFQMKGQALSRFRRNRIGFCVLHPASLAGHACRVEHVDGRITTGHFPQDIAPHQPFFNIRSIRHTVAPNVEASILMEGDTFEMEDQRNWTDASFKTYCTPLSNPFPVWIEEGTRIEQHVIVRLNGDGEIVLVRDDCLRLTVRDEVSGSLSPLGLCMAEEPLTTDAIQKLKLLRLSHLRVDLHLYKANWQKLFERAVQQANGLDTALEIALHLSDSGEDELRELRQLIAPPIPPVVRWLILHRNEMVTSEKWIQLAYKALSGQIGIGTDGFFTELNRKRPRPDTSADFLFYSLNPQVHAVDDLSIIESLPTQGTTITSSHIFANELPIVVSPITLKMRFNPAATSDERIDQIDARQRTWFGAGWTLNSIKYLAESGAASLTYFETVGNLGVMDDNIVFPMYHVFAELGKYARTSMLKTVSNQPISVNGFTLEHNKQRVIFLANHTREDQDVLLDGVTNDYHYQYLPNASPLPLPENSKIILSPYSIVKIF